MKHFQLLSLLSFSVLPPTAIAISKYRMNLKEYHPFIFILCLASLNEFSSSILILNNEENALNANLYTLAESILLAWQFSKWVKSVSKTVFLGMLVPVLLAVWVADNLVLNSPFHFNSLFRICSAFMMILMSINRINKRLFMSGNQNWKDAGYLLAVSVLIYFSFKLFIETIFLCKLGLSNAFNIHLFYLLAIVNCCCNLLLIPAALCIPTKPRFILYC